MCAEQWVIPPCASSSDSLICCSVCCMSLWAFISVTHLRCIELKSCLFSFTCQIEVSSARRAQGIIESALAFMTSVGSLAPCLSPLLNGNRPLPYPGIDIHPLSRSLVCARPMTGGGLFLQKLDCYNDVTIFEFIMVKFFMSLLNSA